MADTAYQVTLNGSAVDNEFYADVVSLTVEENTASGNTFRLQLATTLQDDGSWKYLDDDRLALFTKVSIKIGFTGGGGLAGALGSLLGGGGNDGLEQLFDGYITGFQLSLGSEPGKTDIDVSGMDTSVLMSLEEKISTWPDMADSDIAQQILNNYVAEVQADTTPTVHQENETTVVQRGTDIQFVRDLAQRNGLEFYFETDKDSGNVVAYFRAPQLTSTPQPDLAIQFGDQSNLKSFSARLSGQRPLNVKTQQMDVKADSPNAAQVSDTQLPKLGDNDANTLIGDPLHSRVTPKEAPAQMLVLGPPTRDSTELQSIAQAARDEAGWLITATGEINSDAYETVLRPHRLVLVKGAGKAYSGKYYVTRVVHELKGDGSYTQKFEARRNARDVDGSEQFGDSGLGLPIPGM